VSARPAYRPAQDRQPGERHTVEVYPDGTRWRVTYRQVGWIGGTGAMYALHENPAPTEPGSFAPLWREICSDRIEPDRPGGARVVLLDEIEGANR
jgi:hypothetical protein